MNGEVNYLDGRSLGGYRPPHPGLFGLARHALRASSCFTSRPMQCHVMLSTCNVLAFTAMTLPCIS
jgi:hypothetical protein